MGTRRTGASLAIRGGWLPTDARLGKAPLGFVLAFAICALFVLYAVIGHRNARDGGEGIDRVDAAMLVALTPVPPVGEAGVAPALGRPGLLIAAVRAAVDSSVIADVCDELAMTQLPRATFALLLALLPAAAIGAVVPRRVPTPIAPTGVALVGCGVGEYQASGIRPATSAAMARA